ncbi:MAG: trypsin-like peptidase domain-containing protein [Bacteroidales bacterium]|jgi:serine protease Do
MKKIILNFLLSLVVICSSNVINAQTYVNFEDAAEKSVHAVVHIKTEFERKNSIYDFYFDLRELFNYPNRGSAPIIATGSGVLISSDGYIVTNNHVVQDAVKVEVTLNDKRQYIADIVGTDPSTDLALLKIQEKDLPYMTYGNSDNAKVGQWVLAVGNPMNLTSTVTAGIISAKARNINIIENSSYGSSIESFIQFDAAVNPGNSGGALVNTAGELIGINTAIASGTGYYSGYSFAIPVNLVKKVVEDLRQYGVVQRAYLGVSINDINSQFADENNLKVLKGAYINEVSDIGNAKNSGLKKGDVIIGINGKDINSTSELLENIGQHSPNDLVMVTVNRNGKVMDYDVVLAGLNSKKNIANNEKSEKIDFLGIEVREASPEDLKQYNAQNGVIITKLNDGVVKRAGIKEGFLVTKVDNVYVKSPEQLIKYLSKKRGGVLMEGKYNADVTVYYGFGL